MRGFIVSTKLSILTASLILATSINMAYAADDVNRTVDQATLEQVIRESTGVSGLLRSIGLNGVNIISVEGRASFGTESLSTDGPEIVLEKQLSERVRAQIQLAFQGLIQYEGGELQHKRDWNQFFSEAKIIIDADKNSKIPFVTIIGKQEIETAGFDSEMPNEDNEMLHGLTRVKQAYAVQFQMGPELIKGIDSVMVAVINTGRGNDDTMGENMQSASNGAMIVMTKKISDQIILSGGFSHIAYHGHAENRLNWGAVYESKDGKNKIFFNQALFDYNPLYVDAKNVWTLGYVRKLNENNSVTVEVSQANGVKRELALGYTHQFNKHLSAGLEARKTTCLKPESCIPDVSVNGLIKYNWEK
jgi:hypothetical protein